jgi:hypothetical protein
MKYTLIALLTICNLTRISAQKHNLYTDAGISFSQFYPGLSATYNYKFARWIGVGAGCQAHAWFPTITNPHQYVPGVFGDLRLNIGPRKKNQFFAFMDLGINFYKHTNEDYRNETNVSSVSRDNGSYTGLGMGYFRQTTERGAGFYTSVKIMSNGYEANRQDLVTGEQSVESASRGTLALSFGYRFGNKSADDNNVPSGFLPRREKARSDDGAYGTIASKHNLFVDLGVPFPLFSATYNYKMVKWLGVGGGAQGYKIYRPGTNSKRTTLALFADIRFNMRPEKNNQFFSFLDLGINLYKQDPKYFRDSTTVYNIPHNNGFYSGLGFGYFRRMTERGGGPYASLKLMGNWYTIYGYNIVSEDQNTGLSSMNGAFAFSLGFKF